MLKKVTRRFVLAAVGSVDGRMASNRIIFLYLAILSTAIAIVHSTKVIYVYRGPDLVEKHGAGIIIVPSEKAKCRDERTPDRHNKCRRIVEF